MTCVALLLSAGATAGSAASGAGASSTRSRLQSNRRAARADARQMVQRMRLPGGVSSIASEPRFAKGFAGSYPPGGRYFAADQAFWTTTDSAQSIIAYVRAHRPAGSSLDQGSGSGSDTKTGVTELDVQFSWPAVSRQLINRMLTVSVVTPRHGASVIVARSQSYWFVPRSLGERLPSALHAVLITLRIGSGLPVQSNVRTSKYVVSRAAQVSALVRELNSLPIVQPGTMPISCPLMLSSSQGTGLTLDFKAGRRGATLARVEVGVHRGQSWYDGAGPCSPISFWLGSKRQTSLTSPTFVKQVGRLIGANIS